PLWGISKNTGECSKSHILAEQIISSSSLLKEMRNAYISFREVLNGDDDSLLSVWISEYNSTTIKRLKTFINGLNHDIDAVRNSIKFKWTNGLVEGHVNRLKNKKREMYGRAGFELLRRKVILSKTG
ncbi:MAG: transposase, partial [Tissierellia bacterium]|nr:transposase [Tissierellia bacterium]